MFLGAGLPKMPTQLLRERMKYDFPLIAFSQLDYQLFLKSDKPEEVVLGILVNFQQIEPEDAILNLVKRIRETTQGELSLNRYFQQLRILAQLRNLEADLKDTAMESLEKYVSMERDAFYMIGEERAQERVVRNLLAKMTLKTEQIADLVGVTAEFVEKVKAKIAAEK